MSIVLKKVRRWGLFSPSTLSVQLYFWVQLSFLQRKARPSIQKYVNEAHRKQATKRGKAGIAAMFVMIQICSLHLKQQKKGLQCNFSDSCTVVLHMVRINLTQIGGYLFPKRMCEVIKGSPQSTWNLYLFIKSLEFRSLPQSGLIHRSESKAETPRLEMDSFHFKAKDVECWRNPKNDYF